MASKARLARTTPGMSSLCSVPVRRSGIRMMLRTMTAAPIGTLMKKMYRQSNAVTSRPPNVGPAIVATPATAPQMPNAAPRRSAGNTMVRIASVCGIRSAAPTPCTARPAMSHPTVGENPHAADAAVKSATPMMNSLR